MSDFEDPKHAEYERLLIRSARLDVPDDAARERTLATGLAELAMHRSSRSKAKVTALGLGGLALAAAGAVFYARKPEPPQQPVVVAEKPVAPPSAEPAQPKVLPPCPEVVVAKGTARLIEDWEAHDSRLLPGDGRSGSWAAYDDGTAKQTTPGGSPLFPTLIPGRRGESRRALYAAGGKFEGWGATLGADLAESACYDASAYDGIAFWAKGKGRMQVGMQVIDVQALKFGGFCSTKCYDVHRKAVELGPTWRRYEVRWAELEQTWSEVKLDFDPKRIRNIEFTFLGKDTPFEVWIDDLEFLGGSPSAAPQRGQPAPR